MCNPENIFIIFNNISVKGEKENKEKITIRITVPIINLKKWDIRSLVLNLYNFLMLEPLPRNSINATLSSICCLFQGIIH